MNKKTNKKCHIKSILLKNNNKIRNNNFYSIQYENGQYLFNFFIETIFIRNYCRKIKMYYALL